MEKKLKFEPLDLNDLFDLEKAPWPGESIEDFEKDSGINKKAELFICRHCFRVFAKNKADDKVIIKNTLGVWDFRSAEYSLKFENDICGGCGWSCWISYLP